MAIHFLHVPKSGGTALKYAIRQAGKAEAAESGREFDRTAPWESRFGAVHLQGHGFSLRNVPDGDIAFFSVRDPESRFMSSFYSRQRKGMPRHYSEWKEEEERAFGWFDSPQELALALRSQGETRERAEFAMNSIKHVKRPLSRWLGKPHQFRKKLSQVVYIARQETLSEDFERIKVMLGLPGDLQLPSDEVQAHRTSEKLDRSLTPEMSEAIRDWYAEDLKLLSICDDVRPQLMERVSLARASDRA